MLVTAAVADLRLSHRPQLGRSPAVDRPRRTARLFDRSLAELGDRFSMRGGHMVAQGPLDQVERLAVAHIMAD